ncbi:hypothetical protein Tco_1376407 [Tanacetum coccineum]
MNISFISKLIKPTFEGRLKKAQDQLSDLTMPTGKEILRNPYLICDICRDAHEADECDSNKPREQVDTVGHDGKWIKTEEEDNPEEIQAISFCPRQEPIELLEWKALENQLKPSMVEPPKLELKGLPEHLEYAFIQEDEQFLAVISSALSTHKKAKLLEVLKNHKGAIAWSIADIKGIDSSF